MFRSQALQMIHYLSRPHLGRPRGAVGGEAAFTASRLGTTGDYRTVLDATSRDEIREAVLRTCPDDRPPSRLRRGSLRWPRFRAILADAQQTLGLGRGFVVLRGLPIEGLTDAQREWMFAALGLELGLPGAQNPEGHLLGHVRDEGTQRGETRLYRTNATIAFHCDAADVVGLLCVASSAKGGRSRIASSVSVHDRLLRTAPALVDALYAPFLIDTRAEGGLRHFPVVPCRFDGVRLRTFYHSDYFRSVERHGTALRLLDRQRALLDAYDEAAGDPELCLEMDLEPGDVQLLSNHTVVHGRSGYEDTPGHRRHLLRLWLSLPKSVEPTGGLRARAGLIASIGLHLARGPR